MSELGNIQKKELRERIAIGYTLQEMKLLCSNLDVDWQEVATPDVTRSMFAKEIVDYFGRRGRIQDLIQRVQTDRPNSFNRLDDIGLTMVNGPDEYVNTQSNPTKQGDNSNAWVAFVVIIIGLLIFWSSQSSQQKQKEPDQFVTTYINHLDNSHFQSAWEKLSGDYRINKYPTGYTPYSQYYSSFKNVEILKLEVLEETDVNASVRVVLVLTNFDNNFINQDIVFRLARQSVDDNWLISDSSP